MSSVATGTELRHQIGGRRAWLVWTAAILVYVLAIFHRTSLAVAGLTAADRFNVSASELATFTMVQLLVYAGMQIPVGVMLDRLGSKAMISIGLLLMTVGQLSFAFAATYELGLASRVLVGMGDAMVFVSVLRLVILWFPASRTPVLTQLTGFVGQLGSIVAAIPLAHALASFGWTTAFAGSAAVGVVLGVFLYVAVIDSPYAVASTSTGGGFAVIADNVRRAWAEPGTRLGLWTHFTTQFSVTAMSLLWGYPYLVQGEGVSPMAAGVLLTVMTAMSMVAGPIVGSAVGKRPFNRSTMILSVVAAIVVSWTVVLLWPGPAPLWLLVVLVVVVGVGGPSSVVGFDFARTFNPSHRLGTATGIVNTGGFFASLATIVAIGVVLDLLTPGTSNDYSPHSFAWAMSVQYVVWLVGVVQIWRYRTRTRRALLELHPESYGRLRSGELSVFPPPA